MICSCVSDWWEIVVIIIINRGCICNPRSCMWTPTGQLCRSLSCFGTTSGRWRLESGGDCTWIVKKRGVGSHIVVYCPIQLQVFLHILKTLHLFWGEVYLQYPYGLGGHILCKWTVDLTLCVHQSLTVECSNQCNLALDVHRPISTYIH